MEHNCNSCKSSNAQYIPLAMVELHNGAMERTIKRLWITIIIQAIIIATLATFLYIQNNEYEDIVTTIEAEQETSDGGDNYVVGGDFAYGEAESQSDC